MQLRKLRELEAKETYVAGVTPLSLKPVTGHLGTLGLFLRYWNTSRPPGVLTVLTRLDRVL